jgi:hypothetical protein
MISEEKGGFSKERAAPLDAVIDLFCVFGMLISAYDTQKEALCPALFSQERQKNFLSR